MKICTASMWLATFAVVGLLGSAPSLAQNAYITNSGDNTVSVIDTTTNTVTATIPVGNNPYAVATDPDGSKVYVTNRGDFTVSVIDAITNKVTLTIPDVGGAVAVTPDGDTVYAEFDDPTLTFPEVGVIDTATNHVTTIPVTPFPGLDGDAVTVSPDGKRVYFVFLGKLLVVDTATNMVIGDLSGIAYHNVAIHDVAVSPDGSKLYLTHYRCDIGCPLSVIDTATNTLITEIFSSICGPDGGAGCDYQFSSGVAVAPDGGKVYAVAFPYCECSPEVVLVIDAATNAIIGTIPLPSSSTGFAYDKGLSITPDGSKIYVVNNGFNMVSVIDTTANAVTATIPVGSEPVAWGNFISPPPRFAGMPGKANCHGQSVSALAHRYGGLAAAATALGYSSVQGLQNDIEVYCAG